MTSTIPRGYYAIRDPHEPNRITCWLQPKYGRFSVWPPKALVGPFGAANRADWPRSLDERREVILGLHRQQQEYFAAVRDRIAEDLIDARARFASMYTRCCICGRALDDPKSRMYGIGPDCGEKWSDVALADLARRVGELFAEIEDRGELTGTETPS